MNPHTLQIAEGAITRALVPESERMRFLPWLFPGKANAMPGFLYGELVTFRFAEWLCPSYRGALWSFYRLSNGGGYLAPDLSEDAVAVSWSDNGFSGTMTPDALGVVASIFALNTMFVQAPYHAVLYAERLDLLKDYASEHPEAGLIFRAID